MLALGALLLAAVPALFPFAIEQVDLVDSELVVSSPHFVAQGGITSPDQLHISYAHTPL